MFDKILMVCVGNICRSPSAELLLADKLEKAGKKVEISSAGIAAVVGKGMDPKAAKIVAKSNIDTSKHVARQLTADIAAESDLILVPEKGHIEAVYKIAPFARGKVMLLGKWLDNREIPDPHRQSEEMFNHVIDLVDKACTAWAEKLK